MVGWGLPGPKTLLSSLPSKPDPVKDGKNGTQVRGASSETNQKILPLKNPRCKFRLEECQIKPGKGDQGRKYFKWLLLIAKKLGEFKFRVAGYQIED